MGVTAFGVSLVFVCLFVFLGFAVFPLVLLDFVAVAVAVAVAVSAFDASRLPTRDGFGHFVDKRRDMTDDFDWRVFRTEVVVKPETAVSPRPEPPRPERVTTIVVARRRKDLLFSFEANRFIDSR